MPRGRRTLNVCWSVVLAAILAAALTGCGASVVVVTRTHTVIETRVRTRTVRVTVPQTVTAAAGSVTRSPGTASDGASTDATETDGGYSAAFAAEFTSLCLAKVGDKSACGCALHYIEANVPYSEVKAAEGDLTSGARPSWYYDAVAACL